MRAEEDDMTATLIAETSVDLDAEGFFTDPYQWNQGLAEEIARDNGIPELTERHWLVVRFMRERYLDTGNAPSIRALGKESGVPIKELYQLFPKGPAKLAAKIGGIPKPKGCI
jgi:dissimilatory sulfite reductase related protein